MDAGVPLLSCYLNAVNDVVLAFAQSRFASHRQRDSSLAEWTEDMSLKSIQKLRLCAAMLGSGAMIVLAGGAVYYTQGADVTAAGSSSGAGPVTTPPSVPAITKAVPSITGPAPLYAGEGPDSNPQAPIP